MTGSIAMLTNQRLFCLLLLVDLTIFFGHPKFLWYPAQARLVPWGSPTPGKSICQMQWPENLSFPQGFAGINLRNTWRFSRKNEKAIAGS